MLFGQLFSEFGKPLRCPVVAGLISHIPGFTGCISGSFSLPDPLFYRIRIKAAQLKIKLLNRGGNLIFFFLCFIAVKTIIP